MGHRLLGPLAVLVLLRCDSVLYHLHKVGEMGEHMYLRLSVVEATTFAAYGYTVTHET